MKFAAAAATAATRQGPYKIIQLRHETGYVPLNSLSIMSRKPKEPTKIGGDERPNVAKNTGLSRINRFPAISVIFPSN
jgi:hypothetical protein